MNRWSRAIRGLPVPVFAAAGADAWHAVQELRGRSDMRLTTSPRHASVLLIAGTIPDEHLGALQRVHDQLPHPRAAVIWSGAGAATQMPALIAIDGATVDVTSALREAFVTLLRDPTATADFLLPDEEPHEWRGVGPFGQGGEGMMGGTPYGRPMAMTADDRDGLALDELQLTLGPFLDAFPAGLVLDIALQGDVVTSAAPRDRPAAPPDAVRSFGDHPVGRGRSSARRGLRWLSHALHVQGLDALAARAALLATAIGDGAEDAAVARDVRRLERRIDRSGALRALSGVGLVGGALPHWAEHLRGDADQRWRRRLAAISAALRDGWPQPALAGVVVDPDSDLLERVLVGATLTDAVATITSLDLRIPQFREAAPT